MQGKNTTASGTISMGCYLTMPKRIATIKVIDILKKYTEFYLHYTICIHIEIRNEQIGTI
jgi:hypothetical protein